MSDRPSLADAATKLLAREAARTRPPSREEEEAAVAALEAALGERRTAKARLRWARLALAASAVLLLGAGAWKAAHRETPVATVPPAAIATPSAGEAIGFTVAGSVVLVHAAAQRPLDVGAALEDGDRIVAGTDGRAAIALSSGTHLAIEPGTDVLVSELGAAQAFHVRSGAVRADVAKLAPGHRFLVRTDDVEVEVRGTSFRVEKALEPCAGTMTRVAVSEGRVWVRHAGVESVLGAGDAWPKGCDAHAAIVPTAAKAAPRLAPVPTTTTPSAPSAPLMAPPSHPTSATAPIAPSELAAQNQAFAAAMAKKRGGDVRGAIAAFDAFLGAWPSGPLAENAEVERMRLFASSGDPRAKDAARAYLERRPAGFAKDEAKVLLEGP